jgi:hypothetical protein
MNPNETDHKCDEYCFGECDVCGKLFCKNTEKSAQIQNTEFCNKCLLKELDNVHLSTIDVDFS